MTKTINQLTEITELADDDLLLARDVSAVEDFKITLANLREATGVNQRTIYVGSVAELEDSSYPVGTSVHLTTPEKGGIGTIRAGASPVTDTQKAVYINDANSNHWERDDKSALVPEFFDAVGDYDGTTGANDSVAIKAWLEFPVGYLEATPGKWYWLGEIAGDTALAERSSEVLIDFKGAKVSCQGQTGATYTSTVVLKVNDAPASYYNVTFDDESFASRGAGRGVNFLTVAVTSGDISGCVAGGVELVRAQSFGTFVCSDPTLHSLSGIYIRPDCIVSGESERGITLGGCSHVRGGFTLADYRRMVFSENSKDIDLDIVSGSGSASSGNLLIYGNLAGFGPEDIKLRVVTDAIYSASVFVESPATDIKNVSISITTKSVPDTGTEIIRIGEQDGAGVWLGSSSWASENCKFEVKAPVDCLEFGVQTDSPNAGLIGLETKGTYRFYKGGDTAFFYSGSKFIGGRVHDVTGSALFDLTKIYKSPAEFSFMLSVRVDEDGSTAYKDQTFVVQGRLSAGGVFTLVQAGSMVGLPVGGPNPTITLSASGSNLQIACDTYTGTVSTTAVIEKLAG